MKKCDKSRKIIKKIRITKKYIKRGKLKKNSRNFRKTKSQKIEINRGNGPNKTNTIQNP